MVEKLEHGPTDVFHQINGYDHGNVLPSHTIAAQTDVENTISLGPTPSRIDYS